MAASIIWLFTMQDALTKAAATNKILHRHLEQDLIIRKMSYVPTLFSSMCVPMISSMCLMKWRNPTQLETVFGGKIYCLYFPC